MNVSAIWMRREGEKVVLLFESGGQWFVAARDVADSPFSHIAELDVTGAGPSAGMSIPLTEFESDELP